MLSENQLSAFYQRGFLEIPDFLDKSELTLIREAFDRLDERARSLCTSGSLDGAHFVLGESNGKKKAIKRVVWSGAAEPILLKFGEDRRFLKIAGQLLFASELDHLINQAHFKLPNDGVSFPWHQDSHHRRYGTKEWSDLNGKGSYVQMVLALDRVMQNSGPLMIVPKSCQKGHIPHKIVADYAELPQGSFNPKQAIPILSNPGDLVIFGPYTIHGSSPNVSKSPRRVFINGYAYAGANKRIYPGEGAGRRLKVPVD